jgi:hypothetical protein
VRKRGFEHTARSKDDANTSKSHNLKRVKRMKTCVEVHNRYTNTLTPRLLSAPDRLFGFVFAEATFKCAVGRTSGYHAGTLPIRLPSTPPTSTSNRRDHPHRARHHRVVLCDWLGTAADLAGPGAGFALASLPHAAISHPDALFGPPLTARNTGLGRAASVCWLRAD